jgi:hypothetical protein
VEKIPEPADPNRYLCAEEVERILAVTRLLDTRLGKLSSLILMAFHTGLRVGNLMLRDTPGSGGTGPGEAFSRGFLLSRSCARDKVNGSL